MKTEHDIQNEIRLALSKKGYFTERINVGSGFLMDSSLKNRLFYILMRHGEEAMAKEVDSLRPFSTGAVKGRSDLSAIKNGEISFLEIKNEIGRPSKEQVNFINQMKKRYGCKAGIARSVEDAMKIVEGKNEN